MTRLSILISILWLAAAPKLMAHDRVEPENGGVIILHADYHFMRGTGPCPTVVIVVDDEDLRRVVYEFQGESDAGIVRIDEDGSEIGATSFEVELRPTTGGRMIGHLIHSCQKVLIVPH